VKPNLLVAVISIVVLLASVAVPENVPVVASSFSVPGRLPPVTA
jgi:hypothetical protein